MELGDVRLDDALKRVDTVSFDVFDTLLVRPYVRPHDVFKHAEIIDIMPGFCEARINAEKAVHSRCSKEGTQYTLDDIYDELGPEHASAKETELALERDCIAYSPVKDLYDRIREQGKRIIILSDMYLPSPFIAELLESCGITGFEKLYVSCEHAASKRSGALYRRILDDLGLEPSELLHIGDNMHSDVRMAEKQGITAVHVTPLIETYFRTHKASKRYYRKNRCPGRSMIVAIDAIHWMHNGFRTETDWDEIAYRFGGPAVTDYCRFIHDNSDGRRLVFIARDGYNIRRVYRQLYGPQKDEYLHATRLANILAGSSYRNYRDYKRILIDKFYNYACRGHDDGWVDRFYTEHEEDILRRKESILFSLKRNVSQRIQSGEKLALIDMTTMKFSSQELVSEICEDSDVLGLFYFVIDDSNPLPHLGYSVQNSMIRFGDNVNILEFFMTAPEPPLDNILPNGTLVFKEVDQDERTRLAIYDSVTRGEMKYAEDVTALLKSGLAPIGAEDIRRWIDVLIYGSGQKTRELLASMQWPVDADHSRYVCMIFHPRDSWYHLKKNTLDLGWYILSRIKNWK